MNTGYLENADKSQRVLHKINGKLFYMSHFHLQCFKKIIIPLVIHFLFTVLKLYASDFASFFHVVNSKAFLMFKLYYHNLI